MIDWLRRGKVVEDAAAWYTRMAQPSSDAEVEAFEAWLARDPSHARAYAEMDAVMHAAGAADLARIRPAPPAWATVLRPAIAVGLAVLAIVTIVVALQGAAAPAYAAISNDGVAVRGLRFADGTAVWLDVGARIGVRTIDGHREIAVKEGRVRITPGRATPLTVTARATQVTPGVAPFDVSVTARGIEVSALEEPLEVAWVADTSPVQVGKGRAMLFSANAVQSADPDRTWPNGRLRFASARLDEIVRLANRNGDPDLSVAGGEVAGLKVSGVFDLRDTRRLARKLAATFDLRVEEHEDRLILRR